MIVSKYTILGLQVIAMAVLLYFVFGLDLLPTKYKLGIAGVTVLVFLIYTGIIFSGQKKEKAGHFSKRVAITKVVSVVTSIALLFGASTVMTGDNFIGNVADKDTETHVVSIWAMKDSTKTELQDLKDEPLAVSYQHDATNIAEALASFEDDLGSSLTLEQKDNYVALADALYNGEVEAIVVGDEYIGLMGDKYESFTDDTIKIASYKITNKVDVKTTKTDVTENPFTVYVTGIDIYGDDVSQVSRSDVNLLLTINPKTKQILMTSIPRDTQVTLASKNAMDKLTHTGIYGTEETINTISDFLDTDINYYARTNFTGIVDIVDQLGGVTIDSPYKDFVTLHGNYTITKGINEMDGDKALCFVRERYNLPGGDFDRGKNQMLLLSAMLDKAMSPRIITNFSNILSAIEGAFETDMSEDDINSLINMQLDDMAGWEIFNVQVTGTGDPGNTKTYSMWGTPVDTIIPDKYVVGEIQDLLDKMQSGETIKQADIDAITGEEE
jgi:LCP family protein required for cell wall assembly